MCAKQADTAIDPFAVDLSGGQEMPAFEMLSKGWHKFSLTDYTLVNKPEEHKRYIQLELVHESGASRRAFVNWPLEDDYATPVIYKKGPKEGEQMADADGNPLTVAGSKISVIKTVISALGGPESGKVTPDSFAQLCGNSAMFNVTVSEYPEGSGQFRDQIDLMFGRGVKPC